jgi:type I restriction-modification system DNA methylase subunit
LQKTKNNNFEQQLWKIADTLRGKTDADDFRDYKFGLT